MVAVTLKPAVLWFTGLSGAGKTTIAREVGDRLLAGGARVEYLDGDVIRSVFPETGFTRPERDAHVKRVGFLASRLEHHGVFVICALISPFLESRAYVRGLCRRFVEIHVSTPLTECERRDVKGLYQRARRGEIANFTGIQDPYEPPDAPELRIDTSDMSVQEAADLVMTALRADNHELARAESIIFGRTWTNWINSNTEAFTSCAKPMQHSETWGCSGPLAKTARSCCGSRARHSSGTYHSR
jgi:adenylylsulfate kinase